MKGKILGIIGLFLVSCCFLNMTTNVAPTYAASTCAKGGNLLGFKRWYAGMCDGKGEVKSPASEEELPEFVWKIVLNVTFDIMLAVGYLATAMVVYGGVMYVTSQGDPGKAAKATKTLTSAVIGVAIAMMATVIVNTGIELLGIDRTAGIDEQVRAKDVGEMIGNILNWLYAASGIIAVVFIVKGGVNYTMSQGDPSKIRKATSTLIFSVVGMIVILMAAAITAFVTGAIAGAA